MPAKKIVYRVDFSGRKVGSVKRTSEGYLTGEFPVAKVGVLTYVLSDGTTRKEFVPPETLFNPDSMASLKMKPITDLHPPEAILDSKTVKRHKIGFTGETTIRDKDMFVISGTVTDADSITHVDGGRRELSPGYICELEMTPGTFQGTRYDAIQTKRIYNHLALCDRARGGSDLRLNLDSLENIDGVEVRCDAVLTYQAREDLPDSAFCFVKKGVDGAKVRKFPAFDAAHVRNGLARLGQSNIDAKEKADVLSCLKRKAKQFDIAVSEDGFNVDGMPFDVEKDLEISLDNYNITKTDSQLTKEFVMPKYRIDGIDYEAEQQVINHLGTLQAKLDSQRTELESANKELTEKKAALDAANTKASTLEASFPARVDAAVKERVTIEKVASAVLDEKELTEALKLDSKAIRAKVLSKKYPELKLDGKDESYIQSRLDTLIETIGTEKTTDNMSDQRKKMLKVDAKNDGSAPDVKSKNSMSDFYNNAYKGEKK